jgi:hypothetical protein
MIHLKRLGVGLLYMGACAALGYCMWKFPLAVMVTSLVILAYIFGMSAY